MSKPVSDVVGDWLTLGSGLAVGALAFGVGILAAPLAVPLWARWTLVGALGSLSAVVVCVFMMRGGLIYRFETGKGRLDDLRPLGITAMALLGLGCTCVLVALIGTMLTIPQPSSFAVPSASKALILAEKRLTAEHKMCRRFNYVAPVEVIHGIDSNNPGDDIWHVRFDLQPERRRPKGPCPEAYDIYIDAETGMAVLL